MLNPIKLFTKPEYFFHPRQAARRIQLLWHKPREMEPVTLPWGAVVQVHVCENIGSELYWHGIFDKIVPETIIRLLDSGEVAIDVGANIGQNTCLMAECVGPRGQVLAFEPHPEIFAELQSNSVGWPQADKRLKLERVALGEIEGEANFDSGPEFGHNRGAAALSTSGSGQFQVRLATLDSFVREIPKIGLCKIDVEGHEMGVLKGAISALGRGAIRDIIFEDFNPQPSAVTKMLQQYGYEIWHLAESWLRPLLKNNLAAAGQHSHNFLATLDAGRTRDRFRSAGWRCFSRL